MASDIDVLKQTSYYFPWVRKGISANLTEVDTLGESSEGLSKVRPKLTVTTVYKATKVAKPTVPFTPPEDPVTLNISETNTVQFIGPGDITGISQSAIMNVSPKDASLGFCYEFYPYIEFWEPDFPWRYTPACHSDDKLRPWIALVVCKQDECKVTKFPNGTTQVTFAQDKFEKIFINPKEIWKCAHAQGFTEKEPEFSRILALRKKDPLKNEFLTLETDTEYCAFLIPTFETGRLRGLGLEVEGVEGEESKISAQEPAWEEECNKQKNKPLPFDFPVYHSWCFKTGGDSFEKMALRLEPKSGFDSEFNVDVAHMGVGLDYSAETPPIDVKTGKPFESVIGIPAATVTLETDLSKVNPFPAKGTETYNKLVDLLSKNPVFQENLAAITDPNGVTTETNWAMKDLFSGKINLNTQLNFHFGSAIKNTKGGAGTIAGIKDLKIGIGNTLVGSSNNGNAIKTQEFDINLDSLLMPEGTDEVGDDDPWITPPVYGGKHIMATSLDGDKDTPWISQLNLDVHHRAIAGLGKRTIQIHQEELVNRAWKQVESVNALNEIMRKFLLSVNINKTLAKKTLTKLVAEQQVFSGAPESLATASFQNLARNTQMDITTIMEHLGDEHFLQLEDYKIPELHAAADLERVVTNVKAALKSKDFSNYCIVMQDIIEKVLWGDLYKYIDFYKDENEWDGPYPKMNSITAKPDYKDFFPLKRKKIAFLDKDNYTNNVENYNMIKVPFCRYEFYHKWLDENNSIDGATFHKYMSTFDEKEINSNLEQCNGVYERISNFFSKSKYQDHPFCYGSTFTSLYEFWDTVNHFKQDILENLNEDMNVIGLEDAEFEKIFGKGAPAVIQVGERMIKQDDHYISGNPTYFVSKTTIKTRSDLIKAFKIVPDFRNGNHEKLEFPQKSYKHIPMQYDKATNSFIPNAENKYSSTFKHENIINVNYINGKQLISFSENNSCTVEQSYNLKALFHPVMRFLLHLCPEKTIINNDNVRYWTSYIIHPSKKWSVLTQYFGIDFPSAENHVQEMRTNLGNRIKNGFFLGNANGWDSDKYGKMGDLQKNAIEYISQPDYITLDLKALDDMLKKMNEMEKPKHFAEIKNMDELLKQCYGEIWSARKKYIGALDGAINGFNKAMDAMDLGPRQTIMHEPIDPSYITEAIRPGIMTEPIRPRKEVTSSTGASPEVETINTTEDVMTEVAIRYYTKFFEDSKIGEKLRTRYIQDLLRSKYPIMAHPIFPEPTYYYLNMLSSKFILPCVNELPMDSIALFKSNPAFEEAYLCGMNTEMGKELLWREYPTDQRGSYFQKFWDSETTGEDIEKDNFFDIEPLHTWTGNLGSNHKLSKTDLLIFVIKGKLMKQYPATQVYLLQGAKNPKTKKLVFNGNATEANKGIFRPVMQAALTEDILLVGFKPNMDYKILTGDPGYFLTFEEDLQNLSFNVENNDGERLSNSEFAKDASKIADIMINEPTRVGKHLKLFLQQ